MGDNEHYPHGDNVYSHAQRVLDDIKAEEEAPETDVSSTSNGHIRSTRSRDQKEIIDRITKYVSLKATCYSSPNQWHPKYSCKPAEGLERVGWHGKSTQHDGNPLVGRLCDLLLHR